MIDYARHRQSLEQFVTAHQKKKWVVAICVLGSYVRQEMTPHSDIDVYILTRNAPYNAIGSRTFNGTHIEYFIFPLDLKRKQVASENGPSRLETGIFRDAVPLYDPAGECAALIKLAQKQTRVKTRLKTQDESTRFRYLMHECLLDARECALQEKPIAFHKLAASVIDACTDAVYQKKGKILPAVKKLDDHVESTDSSFAHLLLDFYNCDTLASKIKALTELTNYASALYGRPVTDYEIRIKL